MLIKLLVILSSLFTCYYAAVNSFGYNASNSRISPDSILNATNVVNLTEKWSHAVDGPVFASAISATIDGRDIVFVPTFNGIFLALVRNSGELLWQRNISDYTNSSISNSRGSAFYNGVVVFGDLSACNVVAVNASTGDLLWAVTIDTQPLCHITQAPTISRTGDIYIGISSEEERAFLADPNYQCCVFQGAFFKLSIQNGSVIWRLNTAPSNGGQTGGYSGVAVWGSSPALDYIRNRVYITTGQNYAVPDEAAACLSARTPLDKNLCINETNYVDSILSVDMTTGAVDWAARVTGPDVYNSECTVNCVGRGYAKGTDFGQGPILTSIDFNNTSREVVIAAQKSGLIFAVARSDGSILWKTFVNTIGDSWGSAVDDNYVYTAVNDGGLNLPLHSGQTCNTGHWVALNKNTGGFAWETCNPGSGSVSAAVTVTRSGLLFGAAHDGYLYAFSTEDGSILWTQFVGDDLQANGPLVSIGSVILGHGYRGDNGTTYIRAYDLP
jgi:polyvinyl alcohol dehydrogenase (cytochrome)